MLPRYMVHYDERQLRRFEVAPGITGLAQVSGRNLLSWEEKFDLDVSYVERQSLLLDLTIIVRTVFIVLSGHGISASGHSTMLFSRERKDKMQMNILFLSAGRRVELINEFRAEMRGLGQWVKSLRLIVILSFR